jgi:hypothetical protein
MKKPDIQELGHNSWVDLYQDIRTHGLQNEKYIRITWEDLESEEERERADVNLPMALVQANAFAEIYDALPSKDALDVIRQMVESAEAMAGKKYIQPVLEFLTKIPTRS